MCQLSCVLVRLPFWLLLVVLKLYSHNVCSDPQVSLLLLLTSCLCVCCPAVQTTVCVWGVGVGGGVEGGIHIRQQWEPCGEPDNAISVEPGSHGSIQPRG